MPKYITFSNLIIDDIVLPDGRTFMGTLGGAGTHALIGMRVWSRDLGYVATVGHDFESAHRAQLEKLGVDLRGVIERDGYRTPRAWQLFEPDERRIEIFRTDMQYFYDYTPQFDEIPHDYQQATGVHLDWGQTIGELTQLGGNFAASIRTSSCSGNRHQDTSTPRRTRSARSANRSMSSPRTRKMPKR